MLFDVHENFGHLSWRQQSEELANHSKISESMLGEDAIFSDRSQLISLLDRSDEVLNARYDELKLNQSRSHMLATLETQND